MRSLPPTASVPPTSKPAGAHALISGSGNCAAVEPGPTIVDSVGGILYGHCLRHCNSAERAELEAILNLGRSQTTPNDVRRAISLMRQKGSLAYGADLMVRYHGMLREASADLPQRGLVRLLHKEQRC